MYTDFDALKTQCLACKNCALCETRTQVVFGTGNPAADVLFIGEAPGENEDLQGEPFIGRGGKLLDILLAEVGLKREKNIYITNIVKCRPPKNRDPLPTEQTACLDWLQQQIALIRPKIIVCLGRVAAAKIIRADIKVTKEHGLFLAREDCLYMATLHPAALLRNPNNKPTARADFLTLRNKMQMLGCLL